MAERLAAGIADVERAGSARRVFTGHLRRHGRLSSLGMGHMARRLGFLDPLASAGKRTFGSRLL